MKVTFKKMDETISSIMIGEYNNFITINNHKDFLDQWILYKSIYLYVLNDLYSTIDEQIKSIIKSLTRDSKIKSIGL